LPPTQYPAMQHRFPLSDIDFGPEEEQAVAEVVRSKWLSTGPRTAAFEAEFAEYVGADHAVMVSSCTAGLHLALLAVGIGPGDEVLVPSYTFVASANAVLYCGATPVFVDITGEHDLNLSPDDAAAKITPKTKAIVAVHMCGYPAAMDRILALAEQHDLRVIEDACHALGADYHAAEPASPLHGKHAGTLGDLGCFSFYANKNLPVGEGGMVVTDDPDLAQYVRLGRSHGMTKTSWDKASGKASGYDVVQTGFNYRATEFTAALGSVQLRKLDRHNATRRTVVAAYRDALADIEGLTIPFADRLKDSAHHVMAVLLPDPSLVEPFRSGLDAAGIQTTHHYPPVHGFSHIRSAVGTTDLPVTVDVSSREVTLPLHPLMSPDDARTIADAVRQAMRVAAPV
ncbi:MAG: DegT/DnrJ/EryC1/StrS family aminotransferase, partial [Planctomycetota bacterium]